MNEARMPLGQFQAQHVGVGGDLGDGLARHDNGADRDGYGEDAALRGCKDIAFFNLPGNHGALRLGGFQGIRSHFGSGARFIKLRACSEAPLRKLLLALSLGFRSFGAIAGRSLGRPKIPSLRASFSSATVAITSPVFTSLPLDPKRSNCAAGADAGVDFIGAANGCEHRLRVVDFRLPDLEHVLRLGRDRHRTAEENQRDQAVCLPKAASKLCRKYCSSFPCPFRGSQATHGDTAAAGSSLSPGSAK